MSSQEVVLVTGSSSGLGRLMVETLARRGYRVFAGMRETAGRNAAPRAALAALAERDGLALAALELDVTDEASIEAALARVLAEGGRLDVLVNNAAVSTLGLTEGYTPAQVARLFDTNLLGVVRMNRAVLPHMRRAGRGLLVHMSSGGGRAILPCMAYYCATKFALEALAECYRYELSGLGIDCLLVEPGSYPSPLWDKAARPDDQARCDDYGALSALPARLAEVYETGITGADAPDPQEVADAVARLIALPAGARPLRTLVGERVQEVLPLNQAAETVQRSFMEAYGVAELMRYKPGVPD